MRVKHFGSSLNIIRCMEALSCERLGPAQQVAAGDIAKAQRENAEMRL